MPYQHHLAVNYHHHQNDGNHDDDNRYDDDDHDDYDDDDDDDDCGMWEAGEQSPPHLTNWPNQISAEHCTH